MHLRCYLILLFACCALGPPLFAQQVFGPYTFSSATSPCVAVDVSSMASVGIVVNGTFSMTIQPEAAIGLAAPSNTTVVPIGSTSSSSQSTITTSGYYKALDVAPWTTFELCVSAYTSGTATVYLKPSPHVTASLFGGGGGGGTNNPGGSAGQIQTNGGSVFGAFTASGDATINTTTGVVVNANVLLDALLRCDFSFGR